MPCTAASARGEQLEGAVGGRPRRRGESRASRSRTSASRRVHRVAARSAIDLTWWRRARPRLTLLGAQRDRQPSGRPRPAAAASGTPASTSAPSSMSPLAPLRQSSQPIIGVHEVAAVRRATRAAKTPAPKPLSMLADDDAGSAGVQHAEQGREPAEAGAVADAGRHGDERQADQPADHARQRAFHPGDDDEAVGAARTPSRAASTRCSPATPTSSIRIDCRRRRPGPSSAASAATAASEVPAESDGDLAARRRQLADDDGAARRPSGVRPARAAARRSSSASGRVTSAGRVAAAGLQRCDDRDRLLRRLAGAVDDLGVAGPQRPVGVDPGEAEVGRHRTADRRRAARWRRSALTYPAATCSSSVSTSVRSTVPNLNSATCCSPTSARPEPSPRPRCAPRPKRRAADAVLRPEATVIAALDAVRTGEAAAALVPFENSVEGAVPSTLDELASGSALQIRREVLLPIRFALLVRPGHQARRHQDGLRPLRTPSRSAATGWRPTCRTPPGAPRPPTRMPPVTVAAGLVDAALAGAFAAPLYGLEVLVDGVQDRDDAITRFVLVAQAATPPAPTGVDRTTLVAVRARRPSGRAAGDADRVRGTRREPDPAGIASHRRRPRASTASRSTAKATSRRSGSATC